jgi:hypothetical protein
MIDDEPRFTHAVGAESVALGKSCGICAKRIGIGDRITLAVSPERPSNAIGVHTACLLPPPPRP